MPFQNVDISKIKFNVPNKDDDDLPKMDELIRCGIVNIGDELYIKGHPETSKATLIDSKFVNFNGKKMTLNQWGCEVTGWKSIRIYSYLIKNGDNETLQDKRMKLISEENN